MHKIGQFVQTKCNQWQNIADFLAWRQILSLGHKMALYAVTYYSYILILVVPFGPRFQWSPDITNTACCHRLFLGLLLGVIVRPSGNLPGKTTQSMILKSRRCRLDPSSEKNFSKFLNLQIRWVRLSIRSRQALMSSSVFFCRASSSGPGRHLNAHKSEVSSSDPFSVSYDG